MRSRLRHWCVGHYPFFLIYTGIATIVYLFIEIEIGGKSLRLVG